MFYNNRTKQKRRQLMLDLRKTEINEIALKYLGTSDVSYENKVHCDTKMSPRGWQYKRSGGNSSAGSVLYDSINSKFELLEDISKGAKNDHDLRFYIKKIFKISDREIVKVTNDPSRTGKTVTWNFLYITKK